MWVNFGEREVIEDELRSTGLDQPQLDLRLHAQRKTATAGALVVTELDDRERGVFVTLRDALRDLSQNLHVVEAVDFDQFSGGRPKRVAAHRIAYGSDPEDGDHGKNDIEFLHIRATLACFFPFFTSRHAQLPCTPALAGHGAYDGDAQLATLAL